MSAGDLPGGGTAKGMDISDPVTTGCLRATLRGALEALRERRPQINDLNVFPVPDGDTGTNLMLTVEAAVNALEKCPGASPAEALRAIARGSLMGSRGNSGIILSQLVAGMASAYPLEGAEPLPASLLRDGAKEGVRLSYASVQGPVEGTMLTVAREAAEEMGSQASDDPREMLVWAHRRACESLERTPDLLEALFEAGVVDAGGAGLVAILEGALSAMGVPFVALDWDRYSSGPGRVDYAGPGAGLAFFLDCAPESVPDLEDRLSAMGESLLVAGTSAPYRVHIHTDSTELVLEAARKVGEVTGVESADFSDVAGGAGGPAASLIAAVAFCVGGPVSEAFEALGAVVAGAAPPSTGQVLEAVERANVVTVVLLPNDPDALKVSLMAAKQAGVDVRVVPAESPVQGLAAMEEFMPGDEPGVVFERMAARAGTVRTGSVVRAVRDASINGLEVSNGQAMGFVEGRPMFAAEDVCAAALQVCGELARQGGSMLTCVAGPTLDGGPGFELVAAIRREHPGVDVEWYVTERPRHELMMGME